MKIITAVELLNKENIKFSVNNITFIHFLLLIKIVKKNKVNNIIFLNRTF